MLFFILTYESDEDNHFFFFFFRLTHHEAFGTDVQSERDIMQRIDEDISAQVLALSVPSCKEIYNVSCRTSCACVRARGDFEFCNTPTLLLKRSISFCL